MIGGGGGGGKCTLAVQEKGVWLTQQRSTDLRDVVVPPLPLLFLEFERDASDRTPLDPLHQTRHVSVQTQIKTG